MCVHRFGWLILIDSDIDLARLYGSSINASFVVLMPIARRYSYESFRILKNTGMCVDDTCMVTAFGHIKRGDKHLIAFMLAVTSYRMVLDN